MIGESPVPESPLRRDKPGGGGKKTGDARKVRQSPLRRDKPGGGGKKKGDARKVRQSPLHRDKPGGGEGTPATGSGTVARFVQFVDEYRSVGTTKGSTA
jgi:hypothetical protein